LSSLSAANLKCRCSGPARRSGVDRIEIWLRQINEVPNQTNVYIVDSDAPPVGVGEPGVPKFIAAFCNAIFAATGKRARDLRITKIGLS
jgi:hypothetical protein